MDDLDAAFAAADSFPEQFVREGIDEGRRRGRALGLIEGFSLGMHRGSNVGFEVGKAAGKAAIRQCLGELDASRLLDILKSVPLDTVGDDRYDEFIKAFFEEARRLRLVPRSESVQDNAPKKEEVVPEVEDLF